MHLAPDITRGWLYSVIEEYEDIRESIPALATLQTPGLVIEDHLTRTLGYWNRDRRQIILAGLLFRRGCWSKVAAVLKHEMAHQIVDEVFVVASETDHGPAFKRACALLEIEPDATMQLADQPEAVDSMRRKIEKLLALGQSTNHHEAEQALAKAHELALRYNVRMIESAPTRAHRFRKVGLMYKRIPAHVWAVANLVSDFYFVHYVAHVYCGRHEMLQEGNRQIELYGTEQNLDMAEYVFYFLLRQGEREWRVFRESRPNIKGRRDKTSFLRGVYAGFRSKLDAERHALATEKALVWTGDPSLDAFFKAHNPHVSTRTVGSTVNPHVHDAGVAVGEKLKVHRPIKSGPSEAAGRLLT